MEFLPKECLADKINDCAKCEKLEECINIFMKNIEKKEKIKMPKIQFGEYKKCPN